MNPLQEPCQIELYSLVITWFMDLSYLYLFIDYFVNNSPKKSQKIKKIDWMTLPLAYRINKMIEYWM